MPYKKKETATVESTTDAAVVNEVKQPVTKKKFGQEDLIPCISITPGELFFVGQKSGRLYSWADIDAVTEIEYRDLDYAVVSANKMVMKPRFVINDKYFVDQHKRLSELYDGLYTDGDLRDILNLSPSQMRKAIEALPDGAKDSVKVIAMTMIDNGQFDSIKKVRILDELFDTDMMFRLTNFK